MDLDFGRYLKNGKWDIKTKPGWQTVIYPVAALVAEYYFIHNIIQYSNGAGKAEQLAVSGLAAAIATGYLLKAVWFTKSLAYKDDKLAIKYVFRNKSVIYSLKDIDGFLSSFEQSGMGFRGGGWRQSRYTNFNFVFRFKTNDGIVYTLKDWEYANISVLKAAVMEKLKGKEVERVIGKSNEKGYSWFFLLSFVMVAAIVYYVITQHTGPHQ